MADVFTKAKRSEVMSHIRSRGNRDTELALAKLLRAHKISGWRRHVRVAVESSWLSVEGRKPRQGVERRKRSKTPQPSTFNPQPPFTVRPDFVFPKSRTAVFVDGCFWHGCPKHATKPANNRAFWRRKLAGNKTRDRVVNRALRRAGWRVLRIWEHELRFPESCIRRILEKLSRLHFASPRLAVVD
jgi:DNA mismatch endonuclease (patch repair protein)